MPHAQGKVSSPWDRPCPAAQALAQPGGIHTPSLCEVIDVGVSMLAGQSHSFWACAFPWVGLAPLGTACGDAQRCSSCLQGSSRECWGWGLSLQPLLQGMGLGTVQSWVEGSRRPSVASELGAPPGPALALAPASDPLPLHSTLLRTTKGAFPWLPWT